MIASSVLSNNPQITLGSSPLELGDVRKMGTNVGISNDSLDNFHENVNKKVS